MRVLLNRYYHGTSESFLRAGSTEDGQMILEQDIHSVDLSPILSQPFEKIGKIHYSWLTPLIAQYPAPVDSLMIDALPEHLSESLHRSLKKKRVYDKISTPMRNYLTGLIYQKLDNENVLPVSYLPESSLNVLAEYTKVELVQLCDYIALQDLAEGIRFIVDKKKLNMIYQWLSPAKKQYLKICLHQRDKLPVAKLELDKWDSNDSKLKEILHKRGLVRFAKALSGQHPDLVWAITHILDTGRAAVINHYYTKESIPNVTPTLVQQLQNLMNFLKPKSKT